MRRGRRIYTAEDYFNFLYDLAFNSDDYISLAKCLHEIEYFWVLRMDENRMYDGMEMRKYYLSDENGYLPEDIDIDDEYIFGDFVSVLEVFVGFANRICRDMSGSGDICEFVEMFCKNLGVLMENWGFEELVCKKKIDKWMRGKGFIFGKNVNNDIDLWAQAASWLYENE